MYPNPDFPENKEEDEEFYLKIIGVAVQALNDGHGSLQIIGALELAKKVVIDSSCQIETKIE